MKKKDIVILSNFPWESNLLHRSHALANNFSDLGENVFYIYNKRFIDEVSRDENIKIFGIGALPYLKGYFGFIYYLNNYVYRKKIAKLLSRLSDPVIYVMHPVWSDSIPRGYKTVFDISDDYEYFAKNILWKRRVKNQVKDLVNKADKFVLTNKNLMRLLPSDSEAKVVSNGIDLSDFDSARPKTKNLKKIVGFIGGIYDWVDLELVRKVAEKIPSADVLLVGPTNQKEAVKDLTKMPNVRYAKSVSRKEISSYFASLSVGLIPFVSEDKYPRLKTVDSNKIYQYAYFGIPIISTSFAQSRDLRDIISVAKSEEEFIEMTKQALEKKPSRALIRFAKENSWDKKAQEILKFIS